MSALAYNTIYKTMKQLLFLVTLLFLWGCGSKETNNTTIKTNDNAANAQVIDPATQGEFPTKLTNGLPVYHAMIGVKDTIGGPRVKYMQELVAYTMQNKFAYVDKNNELFIVENADSLTKSMLNPFAPYVMKLHVYYDAIEIAESSNMQVINVGFNSAEATNVSRANLADRPEWYNWTNKHELKTNSLPTCTKNEVKCRAQQLVANVARLVFL